MNFKPGTCYQIIDDMHGKDMKVLTNPSSLSLDENDGPFTYVSLSFSAENVDGSRNNREYQFKTSKNTLIFIKPLVKGKITYYEFFCINENTNIYLLTFTYEQDDFSLFKEV